MLVECPKCKTRYRIDSEKMGNGEVLLRCGKCRGIFRLSGKTTALAVRSAEASGPGTGKRIKVLLANESPDFCRAVKKILENEPLFDVHTCNDGKSALTAIEEMLPDVVVLDVALPLMYGFEVCEAVRKNPAMATVKIILIAAIYDKTRYKREPLSLYGADDYIEKHHIPDSLAAKIYRLASALDHGRGVASPKIPAERDDREFSEQEMAEQENRRMEIILDEQRGTGTAAAPQDAEAHDKARRLARLIVTDIALYNQDLVEEGIRNDSFYTLLDEDIREGRKLYEQRVSAGIRNGTSYLDEAFEMFVANKKRETEMVREPGECGG
jgi:predicted Zn finger-like uncharacterized protein